MLQISRPTVVTAATSSPITLAQAAKQCELNPDDADHQDHLNLLITAAREQWEHDTDTFAISQTVEITANSFDDPFQLVGRPVSAITFIKYYDDNDTLQTVSSSVYGLDATRRQVRLNRLQTWPTHSDRWDAVVVRYVAGHASADAVPAIAKQAMLLLVAHYFENRDMLMSEAMSSMPAYEALVRRFMRSTYP